MEKSRLDFMPTGIVTIKKIDDSKRWQQCGEMGTYVHYWHKTM
jgi:hypothetical protein